MTACCSSVTLRVGMATLRGGSRAEDLNHMSVLRERSETFILNYLLDRVSPCILTSESNARRPADNRHTLGLRTSEGIKLTVTLSA